MKTSKAAPPPELDHEAFLRRSFDIAKRAREGGDHPFGSLLVGPDGRGAARARQRIFRRGGDMTAHAERLLATWASKTYGATSSPAARSTVRRALRDVSGAIYWAGIGRLVYGQSEKDLKRRPARTRRTRPSTCPAASSSPPSAQGGDRRPLLEEDRRRCSAISGMGERKCRRGRQPRFASLLPPAGEG